MPVLKNARHEKFAQSLAKGMSATDAYSSVGYKGDRTAASRLSTNVNISRRVDEIKNKVAEKAEWTSADRLLALKGIFDKTARADPRVAISAIAEANKMQGSYAPVKREVTGANGGPIEYANLTEEEIDARIAALAAGAGEDEPQGEA
jgi:phage terminase small subunit